MIEQLLDNHLPRNILTTFLLRVGNVALEFLCILVVARVLKAPAFGAFAFALSVMGIVAVPAAAGFDRLLIREAAKLNATNDWSLLRGLIGRSTLIVTIVSLSIAIVTVLAAVALHPLYPEEYYVALLVGTGLIPIVASSRIRQAVLQGLGHPVAGQLPEFLVQPAAVILLTASVYLLFGFPRTGAEAIGIQIVGGLTASTVGFLALRRYLPVSVQLARATYVTAYWIRSAAVLAALLSMNMVLMHIDTVMVGLICGPADAGIYRIAGQMAALASLPLTASSVVAAPSIALLYGQRDIAGLTSIVCRAVRISFIGAALVLVALVVLGDLLLSIFGPDFQAGHEALLILAFGYLINGYLGISGYLLIMSNSERLAAAIFAVAAIVDIILNILLVPSWGIEGAATATAISIVLLNVLMSVAVRKSIGLHIGFFPEARFHQTL